MADLFNIVIYTENLTLVLFKNSLPFKTYRICAGKPSTPTPKGNFVIINEAINPGGPFGARWLGLDAPYGDYGIHGTNNPYSIGHYLSNGCIRLHNSDVIELSNYVGKGIQVKIL